MWSASALLDGPMEVTSMNCTAGNGGTKGHLLSLSGFSPLKRKRWRFGAAKHCGTILYQSGQRDRESNRGNWITESLSAKRPGCWYVEYSSTSFSTVLQQAFTTAREEEGLIEPTRLTQVSCSSLNGIRKLRRRPSWM